MTGKARASRQLAAGLRGVRVTVCAEPGERMDEWLRELRRMRAEVTRIWPPPKRFSPGMDILVCECMPQMAEYIPWEPGEAEAALVLLLPRNVRIDESTLTSAAPHGVVALSSSPAGFVAATLVAWSQFRYEKRLRERISRLDENLRLVRLVERAKLILMAERDLSEAAAYSQLRRQAMERRVSVVDVANAIVSAAAERI